MNTYNSHNQYPLPGDPSAPEAATQPVPTADPLSNYQPIRIVRQPQRPRRKKSWGCLSLLVVLAAFLLVGAIYFLAPLRTPILVLGIDRTPPGTALGRSDTMIIFNIVPLRPYVGMLSIPRDLWVSIQGVGENRINTAHFFAEGNQPGSGPRAAVQVVEQNFDVHIPYYLRVRFDGFQEIVEAMGGVTIHLEQPTSGYEPGAHHLNGEEALAFVRDRKGADDFFRMQHGQLFLRAVAMQMLNPTTWPRLPAIAAAVFHSVDTNIPLWQWSRLGLAVLRALPGGFDNRTLPREMVTPTVTSGGAAVLMPDWNQIHPLVQEMMRKW